jgi:hypothetical protein
VQFQTPFSNLQQSGGALSLKHFRVGLVQGHLAEQPEVQTGEPLLQTQPPEEEAPEEEAPEEPLDVVQPEVHE